MCLYEGKKEKNGKTSAKTERQAHRFNNLETDRSKQGITGERSKSKRSVNIELFAGMLAEIEGEKMNWKRGINRLVWVVSIFAGVMVFVIGEGFYNEGDTNTNLFYGAVTFVFVWLVYVLVMYIYNGFQENNSKDTAKVFFDPFGIGRNCPKSRFWQWVTGRFSPENDPYRKKEKQK